MAKPRATKAPKLPALISFAEAVRLAIGVGLERPEERITAAFKNGELPWVVDDSYIEERAMETEVRLAPVEEPSFAPGEEYLEIMAESAAYGALRACILESVPAKDALFVATAFAAWLDKEVAAAQQPAPEPSPPPPEPAALQVSESEPTAKPARWRAFTDCSVGTYKQHYEEMKQTKGLRPSLKEDEEWARGHYRIKGMAKVRAKFKKTLSPRERAEWKSGPRKLRG